MIRILFDEDGDAHNDLILKIDSITSFTQVADSYFIVDFLNVKNSDNKRVIFDYLSYIKNKFLELDNSEIFIPFDLSDEYIGGLFFELKEKGLVKVTYAFSSKIQGWDTSKESIDKQVSEYRESFITDNEWLISLESIKNGINISIERLGIS